MTGDEIKALRTRLDITKGQLAHLIGTEQKTISRWELGKVIPSPKYRHRLDDLAQNHDTDNYQYRIQEAKWQAL